MKKLLIQLSVLLCLFLAAAAPAAETGAVEDRYGMALISGNPFDPVSDIHFFQASLFGIWDYDKVWGFWAPENLRFKVEVNAGATATPWVRTVLSTEMLAQYYMESLKTRQLSPFFNAGIGLIYTDFQTRDHDTGEEMGLRLNCNPQLGVGTDIRVEDGPPFFVEARLSHISNAGLDDDNRGLNSVLLLFGRYF